MPIPNYLRDEEDEEEFPFLSNLDDLDEEQKRDSPQAVAAGAVESPVSFSDSVGAAPPDSPSTPKKELNYSPVRQASEVTPEMRRLLSGSAAALDHAPDTNADSATTGAPAASPDGPDAYPTVTPEMQRILAGSQPDPAKAYTDALARRTRVIAEKPAAPSPKWWQRVAAGAVGGMVGYTNAAGRVKQPIDPTAAISGILAPGQHAREVNWWNRVQAANADVEANKDTLDAGVKLGQVATPENDLKRSQAKQAGAMADYNIHRAASEKNRFKDTRAGVLDTQTGQIIQAPQSDVDKMNARDLYARNQGWSERTHPGVTQWIAEGKWGAAPVTRTLEQMAAQVLADDTIPDDQKQARLEQIRRANNAIHPEHPVTHFETDAQGNVTAVTVNPSEVAGAGGRKQFGAIGKPIGSGDQPKPAGPAQFRLVEQNKNRRFDTARAAWEKDKSTINQQFGTTPPTDPAAQQAWQQGRQAAMQDVDNRYRTAQREALNAYNGELSAIGGTPSVFDIGWDQNSPQVPPSPNGGGRGTPSGGRGGQGMFPRSRLAAFAAANGITAAQAEIQLKGQGYQIR